VKSFNSSIFVIEVPVTIEECGEGQTEEETVESNFPLCVTGKIFLTKIKLNIKILKY
jgi:hypothetical protein